ncbi:MAG: hypothetical protein JHD23_10480 [Akkermansiaceae bacterium]|nr:hypothetical protein [Akkermansiaceae bacterium]
MKITNITFLTLLSLWLVSCEKSKNQAAVTEQSKQARVTKSERPERDELAATPAELREMMKRAVTIQSPQEREQALQEIVWNAIEIDPDLAQEAFLQMTPGSEEKNQLIQHFAMTLAGENHEAAMQWAAGLKNDQEEALALNSIALVLSENDPVKAAQILSDSGVAGRDLDVAVVQVIQRWADISPADAAAWVQLFDSGEARQAGLKAIISTWIRADPRGTMSWISSLQRPEIYQDATLGMAETIFDLPVSEQEEMLKIAAPEVRAHFEKLKSSAVAR